MGNMTLVVDRRGSRVDLARVGVVRIHDPDGGQQRVGLRLLGDVVVHGDVGLSSRFLRACLREGVGVTLLSNRGPQQAVHCVPPPHGDVRLRIAQYEGWRCARVRLRIARSFVVGKIVRQREELHALGVRAPLERFERMAQEAESLDRLRGIEGAAAARYYSLWKQCWKEPWRFDGRKRRPPRDPVNALLSLGYTLATQAAGRMVAAMGLDTALGFLHEPARERPALALDVVEPARPSVDAAVRGWLCNDQALDPGAFRDDRQYGVRLGKDGRGKFYRWWYAEVSKRLDAELRKVARTVVNAVRTCAEGMGEPWMEESVR